MSTKKGRPPKNKLLTFLAFIELKTSKASPDIYNPLGWDRRRYHKQKGNRFFPFEHLEELRLSLGLTEPQFYSLVRQYLNNA